MAGLQLAVRPSNRFCPDTFDLRRWYLVPSTVSAIASRDIRSDTRIGLRSPRSRYVLSSKSREVW